MTGPRVGVVGGGVLGLTCALRLAQHGARVTVYEAEPRRPNASSVAAGMIAPGTECAMEPALREVAGFLAAAGAAWTALAAELAVPLRRSGALHAGGVEALRSRRQDLERLGFAVQPIAEPPGGRAASIFLPQDALIAAGPTLAALRSAIVRAGGVLQEGRVSRGRCGFEAHGEPLPVDAVVLSPGAPGAGGGLAGELSRLTPIKGQLLRWPGPGRRRPILRLDGDFYLTSQAEEIVVGATMEPGRSDLEPEPHLLEPHRAQAEALIPALRDRTPELCVGVRVDTPDGLPLVGPAAEAGVFLAAGARRNGWLFAPPVASIVTAQVMGLPLGPLAPLAERLHPGRFTRGEAV